MTTEEIARLDARRKPEDQQILACLRNEIGVAQARAADAQRAARSYAQAIDTDSNTVPAYLNLGDLQEHQGSLSAAIEAWERLLDAAPDRACLAFGRLEQAYRASSAPRRFVEVCERVIAQRTVSRHSSAKNIC